MITSATKVFRFLSAALVAVLIFGVLVGRKIERAFPDFVWVIPWVGLIGFGAVTLFAIHRLKATRRWMSWRHYLPFITTNLFFLGIAAFVASSLSLYPIEQMHVVKYSALGFALFFSFDEERPRRLLLALLVGVIIGCLEELSQQFVPTRVVDVRDIATNTCFVCIGSVWAYANAKVLTAASRR